MNTLPPFPERIRTVLQPAGPGVVELVDELLRLCPEQGFAMAWQGGRCCVSRFAVVPVESIEVPLPKSAFRAVLARLAALCSERAPDSVSPYGGEGQILAGTDAPALVRVVFWNTLDEQRVEMRPVAGGNGGTDNVHRYEAACHSARAIKDRR